MFRAGVVTVYVSDMDRAVKFYTETLGFPLKEHFGRGGVQTDGQPGAAVDARPVVAEALLQREAQRLGVELDGAIHVADVNRHDSGSKHSAPPAGYYG